MINRDSTAEAMWAHVLTVWQEKGLPTPSCIDAMDHTVWLPNNERGQVDVWAAALGLTVPTTGDEWRRADGTAAKSVSYRAYAPDILASHLSVICTVELGDAGLHWSRPEVAVSPLSLAARTVAAMLTPDSPDLPAEPAAPRPYNPRPHSIVAGFGGAFCEPCRTAPDDYRCEDLMCSCRCRAVDLAAALYPETAPAAVDHGHTHPGSDAPCYCEITDADLAEQHIPVAPVAIDPERVAYIVAELNGEHHRGYADPYRLYIARLPEFRPGSAVFAGGLVVGFSLVDGTGIGRGPRGPWMVRPAPVAVSPVRVAEICVELNRLNLEGAADAETVYIWNLPELDRVTQRSELNEAYAFMLHGGIAVEFSSAHGWQQVTA